jgi:hypothetical protein
MQELSTTATGFSGSDEFNKASDLLSAFDDRDQDRLAEVGKAQLFTFLIPDISRIVKKLKVPGGGSPTAVKKGAAPATQEDDEDIR